MASPTIFAAHLLDTADAGMQGLIAAGHQNLAMGAKEFAFLTGTRISGITPANTITLSTPNGLLVGTLSRIPPDDKGYYYGCTDSDKVFCFTSHAIVVRDRGRRRDGHDAKFQRQGKTIKGMVQSIKKNDRAITEETVMRYICKDMYQAFGAPCSKVQEAAIRYNRNWDVPLVKYVLGIDKFSIMQHEQQLQQAYDAYLVANKKYLEAQENMKRFANGATFIGMTANGAAGPLYICTARLHDRTKYTERAVEFITPLKRYETLPDEFGGIAAICKAHMPGTGRAVSQVHPFGITGYDDHYYEDVDVVCEVSSLMHWTVIPTDIAEDAAYAYLF